MFCHFSQLIKSRDFRSKDIVSSLVEMILGKHAIEILRKTWIKN